MTQNSATRSLIDALAKRVSELEREIAALKLQAMAAPEKDWRKTIGMFTGDDVMKQIDAAGAAIRQKERDAARRKKPSRKHVKA